MGSLIQPYKIQRTDKKKMPKKMMKKQQQQQQEREKIVSGFIHILLVLVYQSRKRSKINDIEFM